MTDVPHDVIIVLGATQKADGSPGPAMARRVAHGVDRWKQGLAPEILMTGGCTACDVPESRTMADLAIELGASAGRVHTEEKSTRTVENAIEARKVMLAKTWARALLVTDTFHMPRSLYCFRAFGVDVTPDANPVPMTFLSAVSYARETVARFTYPVTVSRYMAGQS